MEYRNHQHGVGHTSSLYPSIFFLWRFTRALWHSKLHKAFLLAQLTEKASLENCYRPCLYTTAVDTQNWTVQDQSGETEITCQPCCLADNAANPQNVSTYSSPYFRRRLKVRVWHFMVKYTVTSCAFPLVYRCVQTRRRVKDGLSRLQCQTSRTALLPVLSFEMGCPKTEIIRV